MFRLGIFFPEFSFSGNFFSAEFRIGPGQTTGHMRGREEPEFGLKEPRVQHIVHVFPDLVPGGRVLIGKRPEKIPAVRVCLGEFFKDLPAHAPMGLIQAAHHQKLDDPDGGPFGLERSVEDLPYRGFLLFRKCRTIPNATMDNKPSGSERKNQSGFPGGVLPGLAGRYRKRLVPACDLPVIARAR